MTANVMLKDYENLQSRDTETTNTIQNTISTISKEPVLYAPKENAEFKTDYDRVLHLTLISLRTHSTSEFKSHEYLNLNDVDSIKNALRNYCNNNERIAEFKKELIDDLTKFQDKINTKHIERIDALTKQKENIENQIKLLEKEQIKLNLQKMPKFFWSNSNRPLKECEAKIAALKGQSQQCTNKIGILKQEGPTANEKDILIHQMLLKEKYNQKIKLLVY